MKNSKIKRPSLSHPLFEEMIEEYKKMQQEYEYRKVYRNNPILAKRYITK